MQFHDIPTRQDLVGRRGPSAKRALEVVARLERGDDVQLVEHAVAVPVPLAPRGRLAGEVLATLQDLDHIELVESPVLVGISRPIDPLDRAARRQARSSRAADTRTRRYEFQLIHTGTCGQCVQIPQCPSLVVAGGQCGRTGKQPVDVFGGPGELEIRQVQPRNRLAEDHGDARHGRGPRAGRHAGDRDREGLFAGVGDGRQHQLRVRASVRVAGLDLDFVHVIPVGIGGFLEVHAPEKSEFAGDGVDGKGLQIGASSQGELQRVSLRIDRCHLAHGHGVFGNCKGRSGCDHRRAVLGLAKRQGVAIREPALEALNPDEIHLA